jgi:protein-L-isoaspartate O-methyltransferase
MSTTTSAREEKAVSFAELMTAVGDLQVATVALAATGARVSVTDPDGIPRPVAARIDAVLAAASITEIDELPPPQRAMIGSYIRSAFAQAADILDRPTRDAGWTYVDAAVLEGQGRGSMMMPTLLSQTGAFETVDDMLDVGTGVGWLAVGASRVWPNCNVVGVDTWEPSLERARTNVADSGLSDRIELRNQSVTDLPDRDRFDLTWLPLFFIPPDVVPTALKRILDATRPGGQIAVARYDAPNDELAKATLQLRVFRDGGSWYEDDEVVALLGAAGWTDVRVLSKPNLTITFIAGRRP